MLSCGPGRACDTLYALLASRPCLALHPLRALWALQTLGPIRSAFTGVALVPFGSLLPRGTGRALCAGHAARNFEEEAHGIRNELCLRSLPGLQRLGFRRDAVDVQEGIQGIFQQLTCSLLVLCGGLLAVGGGLLAVGGGLLAVPGGTGALDSLIPCP